MLVEFRVTNFRSIRETQTLSMVASADKKHLASNCVATGINGLPYLTRGGVLYGPNASGKSNLISALSFMRGVVETSATTSREGQKFNIAPFSFDPEWASKPSEFEITFICDNIRYQYNFALDTQRIVYETLFVYNSRKPQRWFERSYRYEDKNYANKTENYKWHFGSNFSSKQQQELWKNSTRSNALFLSTAVNLNSEQLRPIFNWFINNLQIISDRGLDLPHFTIEYIKEENNKNRVMQILKAADFQITDLNVEMRKGQRVNFKLNTEKSFMPTLEEIELPYVTFLHPGKDGKMVSLGFENESKGTQRTFAYLGPILNMINLGYTLIVDEFDNSLHPELVRFFIKNFNNQNSNRKAQLFFSTHNTTLLDPDLFRRDQIWFMEKDKEQASRLYPLTDFSPRSNEALEKGYLMGRYDALPFFGDIGF